MNNEYAEVLNELIEMVESEQIKSNNLIEKTIH